MSLGHTPPDAPQDPADARGVWGRLFDKVWVLSLPDAHERRAHVAQHLPAHGLEQFEFFDATPADAPEVSQAMASGEVMQFPPCFRCGALDCGKIDCNNFLIPAQVACFLSYRRLWRAIAGGVAERVLVLEDDVFLHGHAVSVLQWLSVQIQAGTVPFQPGRSCLLRLGWAHCADHVATDPDQFRVDSSLRMSNPCHALTRAYAHALLARDQGISHTADVYQHKLAPQPGEAFTVFPPLASELSWTDGRFASTIHPKPVHVQHLQARGDVEAAEREALRLRQHTKKKHFRPLLISGHPRGGTGYTAALCRQLGLDVGHEKLGRDGISSWMFAVEAEANPYALDEVARSRRALAWQHLVMVVRDPATAAPSVMRDSQHAPPSYTFRREQILRHLGVDLDALPNPLERALWSLTSWARILLAQQPALVMRLEDGHEALRHFLIRQRLLMPDFERASLSTQPVNADKRYKGVVHPKPVLAPADWHGLQPVTREELQWYCQTFGYPLPWVAVAPPPGRSGPSEVQSPTSHAAPAAPSAAAKVAAGAASPLSALDRQFLSPSGWSRSQAEQAPVDAAGQPLPWFTYAAIELLPRVLRPQDRVFEFGAGHSTLWWQRRVAQVASVEHDADWCERLRPQLAPGVDLCARPFDHPASEAARQRVAPFFLRQRRTDWPYDAAKVVRRGLDDEHFIAYATRLDDVDPEGLGFDVIVVDGMARRLCTWVALQHLRPDGLLILDNSNRSDYDLAYTLLSEAGLHHLPLWGLVPGANFHTCTSLFTRSLARLPLGGFLANQFGLPEY